MSAVDSTSGVRMTLVPARIPSPRAAASTTRSKATPKAAASKRWYCVSCEHSFATAAELRSHQAVAHSAPRPDAQQQKPTKAKLKTSASARAAAATKAAIRSASKQASNAAQGLSVMAPPEMLRHAANAELPPPEPELLDDEFFPAEESSDGFESSSSLGSDGYESSSDSCVSSSSSSYDASEERSAAQEHEDEPTQPWRCVECACGFACEDQLLAHCADHVACPELECAFVATGRVVRQHQVAAHGLVEPSCSSCGRLGHETSACRRVLQPPVAPKPTAKAKAKPTNKPKTKTPVAVAAPSAKPTKKQIKPWRCAVCDVGFRLEPQLSQHTSMHWKCSEPGCSYEASQLVVATHKLTMHGVHETMATAKTKKALKIPDGYVCKTCGVPGHFKNHCPSKKPEQGYVCMICKIPGHFVQQYPMKPTTATTATTKKKTKKLETKLYSGYVCKACGVPGHLIYQCEKKLSRKDLAVLQSQTPPEQTAGDAASAASADEASATALARTTAAASPVSANANKRYRCVPCGKELALQSQLVAHIKQHVQLVAPLFGESFKAAPGALDSASLSAGATDDDYATLFDALAVAAAIRAARADTHGVWRCIPCKLAFSSSAELCAHTQEHISCLAAHCGFSASKEVVLSHIVAAHALADAHFPVPAPQLVYREMERADTGAMRTPSLATETKRVDGMDGSSDGRGSRLWRCEPCGTTFAGEPAWLVHVGQHAVLDAALDAASPHLPIPTDAAALEQERTTSGLGGRRWFYDPPAASSEGEKACKFCHGAGHWTRECPVRPANSVPPQGYRCKLCNVPGHWHCDCPSVAAGRSTQVARSEPSKTCKFCFEAGHWTSNCPKRDVTRLPPVGYCCKICRVTGHWVYDCPRIVGAKGRAHDLREINSVPAAASLAAAGPAENDNDSLTHARPPVRTYCCVACGIPGHSIFKCPMKLKRADLVEAQQQAVQLELQPISPTSVATNAEAELAAARLSQLTASLKPWRCEPCDKNFAVKSQLAAHLARHVLCSAPGCEFSAAKRVMTVHAKVVHG
ncbi:hypothetical protein PybrP1_002717 [[Pythium] brassicae (nom. inval.)]|nr:hypothetical protein PybrP1_002717 [[Pythium] brassicae (nom. inval.)]